MVDPLIARWFSSTQSVTVTPEGMPKKTNSQFDWENDPIDGGDSGDSLFSKSNPYWMGCWGKKLPGSHHFSNRWSYMVSGNDPIHNWTNRTASGHGIWGNACYIYICYIYIYICYVYIYILSGWWFGTWFFFHSLGNVIIPTDSYFSEG